MDAPGVDLLLEVDREYREKAPAGLLPRIAPRRLNPEGKAWLPVLHTRFGPWHFTALFSNTHRAHELHRVYDWVVIFYSHPEDGEGQATVVTDPWLLQRLGFDPAYGSGPGSTVVTDVCTILVYFAVVRAFGL